MKTSLKSKFALGISLFILGFLLVFGGKRQTDFVSYTFAQEPVEVQGFTSDKYYYRAEPRRIIIPDLSIDLIVKRAEIIDGYWEVFEDMAAWGVDSGYPGESGNQVIFAHAKEGLFLPLKEVSSGMSIYVLTDGTWYIYEVVKIKEVFPNNREVIAPTEDETLTLYTCSGFNDSKRLVVTAKRMFY
jgi:LPXTG-site transpeptidase (sortase) family protein